MDIHHRVPIGLFHIGKGLVAQYPGVVDEDVHLAEVLDSGLDDVFAALGGGDAVIVGHRDTAEGLDLFHDLLGGRIV